MKIKKKKTSWVFKRFRFKKSTKINRRIFPKGNETEGVKDKLSKIKRYENKVIRNNFFDDLSKQPFDFRTFKTIRSFRDDIYNKRVNIVKQIKNRAKTKEKKRKNDVFDSVRNLSKGRELVINAFKSGLFPLKPTTGTGPKISAPKQMLHRLPIALAQVKAGNNSDRLLNEIRQIV